MKTRTLIFTFSSGVLNLGAFSTSVAVKNCPSIAEGYNFLGKKLQKEMGGASRVNHNPELTGFLRAYDYKTEVPRYVSHKQR